MDLVKILKNKSYQYDKDKREGDIADKQHQQKIEKQEKENDKIFKLMETSGYKALTDKLREELKSQGLKRGDIARKVSEIIGTFEPKKNYHNFDKSKKPNINELVNSDKITNKKIRKTIDDIMKSIKVKLPKKKK